MKLLNKIYLCFFICATAVSFTHTSDAKEPCSTCDKSKVQRLPEVPLGDAAIAAIFEKMTEKERSRFEQLLDYQCDKFKYAGMDRGLMIGWIADLEDVPKTKVYPLEAYLTKSGCEAEGINRGERLSLIHI